MWVCCLIEQSIHITHRGLATAESLQLPEFAILCNILHYAATDFAQMFANNCHFIKFIDLRY